MRRLYKPDADLYDILSIQPTVSNDDALVAARGYRFNGGSPSVARRAEFIFGHDDNRVRYDTERAQYLAKRGRFDTERTLHRGLESASSASSPVGPVSMAIQIKWFWVRRQWRERRGLRYSSISVAMVTLVLALLGVGNPAAPAANAGSISAAPNHSASPGASSGPSASPGAPPSSQVVGLTLVKDDQCSSENAQWLTLTDPDAKGWNTPASRWGYHYGGNTRETGGLRMSSTLGYDHATNTVIPSGSRKLMVGMAVHYIDAKGKDKVHYYKIEGNWNFVVPLTDPATKPAGSQKLTKIVICANA
ncbi:MAG TPA: hypothetical protein VHQ86_00655 [Candidatus Saccharimonadia bacterium]|jgi:hypothetical protein|nr:hypothetical protein [Candidatus Saccharimonadia bacterium]